MPRRLALNQNQPLGNSRFHAQIERKRGERREAQRRGRGSGCNCKTNDADPNGTYLSAAPL